jgi:hypothetical protein
MVQLGKGARLVLITHAISGVQVLPGVQVVKAKLVFRQNAARSRNPASAQEQHNGCGPAIQDFSAKHFTILICGEGEIDGLIRAFGRL